MIPEVQRNQGDTGEPIYETVTFDVAVNLTAATVQFIYTNLDDEDETVRSAVIVSSTPSAAAATSAVMKRTLTTADVSTVGYFKYKWKLTLATSQTITKPGLEDCTTDDYPSRSLPVFQVIESTGVEVVESEEGDFIAVGPSIVVDDLTELAALPYSESYQVAIAVHDLNQILSFWEWDETVVTADAVPNSVVPLTADEGGGWRRSDL